MLSPDAHGWSPNEGQLDLFGKDIPKGLYTTKQFERVVSLLSRTEAAARHLTAYLKRTDRMAKTIVFCVDQEHADQFVIVVRSVDRLMEDGEGRTIWRAQVDARLAGAFVSPEYPTFRIDKSRLLPGFFRGIAKSQWFWDQLLGTTRGSMVRRKRVNASDVLSTRIWLPDLTQQARIAAELRAIEAAQDRAEQSDVRIAALTPSLLNQAFGGLS